MPRTASVLTRGALTAVSAAAAGLVGLVAVLVTALSPGIAAAASHATHASMAVQASTSQSSLLPRPSDVEGGRFVASVALDTGAFKVVPAPSHDQPTVSRKQAAQEIWSSPAILGYSQEGPIGFGLVTISTPVKGRPRITKVAAWVGFAKSSGDANCPAEAVPSTGTASGINATRAGPSPEEAPSNGYAAVVIGAGNGSPAVTYTARSILCESLRPASLALASEVVSVPWQETGGVANDTIRVRATLPPCGTMHGISSGGSAQEWTITVQAVVPDVHGSNCKGSQVTNQTVSLGPVGNPPGAPPPLVTASTKIQHGRLGPSTTANAPASAS